jgi:hypothetical protein
MHLPDPHMIDICRVINVKVRMSSVACGLQPSTATTNDSNTRKLLTQAFGTLSVLHLRNSPVSLICHSVLSHHEQPVRGLEEE